ncbi:hypothetical protein Pelo_3392 [Pelomyxa schiedti]|nr:hypothetical protein Pelo_3392 [Pelomyxa schiedti]
MILSTLTRRSGCRRPVHVAAQSDFNGPGQNYCMYLLCFLPGNLPDGNLIQPTQERHTPRRLCVWLCSPFCRPLFSHIRPCAELAGSAVMAPKVNTFVVSPHSGIIGTFSLAQLCVGQVLHTPHPFCISGTLWHWCRISCLELMLSPSGTTAGMNTTPGPTSTHLLTPTAQLHTHPLTLALSTTSNQDLRRDGECGADKGDAATMNNETTNNDGGSSTTSGNSAFKTLMFTIPCHFNYIYVSIYLPWLWPQATQNQVVFGSLFLPLAISPLFLFTFWKLPILAFWEKTTSSVSIRRNLHFQYVKSCIQCVRNYVE